MNSRSRIARAGAAASIVLSLVLALAPGRAKAAVMETCTPTSVWFQQATGSPGEALVITCSDNTFYMLFVSTNTACGADIGTVRSMQQIAVTGRVAGAPLTIWSTPTAGCASNTLNIINSVSL